MVILLVLLGGCNGCQPKLPPADDDQDRTDTGEPQDDTADSGETGPPPLCEVEEIEPNNGTEQAQALPMEAWACGVFDPRLDTEMLTFTTSEESWIAVQAEAEARGSPADVAITLTDGENSAAKNDGYLTVDPLFTFPAPPGGGTWTVMLGENDSSGGEDYRWWLRASVTKPPVDWSFQETEPNDDSATATVFQLGGTAYGVLEQAGAFDWYKVTIPEASYVEVEIVAWEFGSPSDTKIILYNDALEQIREDRFGQIDYDRDPWFEMRVASARDLYLSIRDEAGRGSPYHWYTLSIRATPMGG